MLCAKGGASYRRYTMGKSKYYGHNPRTASRNQAYVEGSAYNAAVSQFEKTGRLPTPKKGKGYRGPRGDRAARAAHAYATLARTYLNPYKGVKTSRRLRQMRRNFGDYVHVSALEALRAANPGVDMVLDDATGDIILGTTTVPDEGDVKWETVTHIPADALPDEPQGSA